MRTEQKKWLIFQTFATPPFLHIHLDEISSLFYSCEGTLNLGRHLDRENRPLIQRGWWAGRVWDSGFLILPSGGEQLWLSLPSQASPLIATSLKMPHSSPLHFTYFSSTASAEKNENVLFLRIKQSIFIYFSLINMHIFLV